MLANAAIKDQSQDVKQHRAANDAYVGLKPAFPLDQARERKHDRYAGNENEQWKDEIEEIKDFPAGMRQLRAEKITDAADDRSLVGTDLRQRQDHAVAAE